MEHSHRKTVCSTILDHNNWCSSSLTSSFMVHIYILLHVYFRLLHVGCLSGKERSMGVMLKSHALWIKADKGSESVFQ